MFTFNDLILVFLHLWFYSSVETYFWLWNTVPLSRNTNPILIPIETSWRLIRVLEFFIKISLSFLSTANKYQSNLNEIDKFEHKSSLDELNKGFSWPTGHMGKNLGTFRVHIPNIFFPWELYHMECYISNANAYLSRVTFVEEKKTLTICSFVRIFFFPHPGIKQHPHINILWICALLTVLYSHF